MRGTALLTGGGGGRVERGLCTRVEMKMMRAVLCNESERMAFFYRTFFFNWIMCLYNMRGFLYYRVHCRGPPNGTYCTVLHRQRDSVL